MTDTLSRARATNESSEPGYILRVSDRTTAAMQLAAYFTEQSMQLSTSDDPRARLAEQLSYFDLAFRSIMSSTARTIIKNSAAVADSDGDGRGRSVTSEFRVG
jgi:hypothetical protein